MRHIEIASVLAQLPEEWFQSARKGINALKQAAREERAACFNDFLKANENLWADLKDSFFKVSGGKCWYSERKLPLGELFLDHFRPRRKVAKCQHRGYWWLSLRWDNLRLCSGLANTRRRDPATRLIGGKGTFFPLFPGSRRVGDTVPKSIKCERPLLIDPLKSHEVALLDYRSEGKVASRLSEKEKPSAYGRVLCTIEYYHLNESTLISIRGVKAANISLCVGIIQRFLPLALAGEAISTFDQELLDGAFRSLRECVAWNAEYSQFCRSCILQFGDLGWNIELLEQTPG